MLPLRTDLQEEGGSRGLDLGAGGALGASLAVGQRAAVLRRRFADLSPTLLLFLQRLSRIVVREEEQPGMGTGGLPSAAVGAAAEQPQMADGSAGGSGGGGTASGRAAVGSVKVVAMERRVLRQEKENETGGQAAGTTTLGKGQGQLVQLLVHTTSTTSGAPGLPGESCPLAAGSTLCSM